MYDRRLSVKHTVEKLLADKSREKSQVSETHQKDEINTKVPLQWKALMRWIEEYCADCNSEIGEKRLEFEKDGGNKFRVVLRSGPHDYTLSVAFDSLLYEVSYIRDLGGWTNIADKQILGKRMQSFSSEIDGDDLRFTHQGMRVTIDQMGETLVRFLLEPLNPL
jgi:hypothetical protein